MLFFFSPQTLHNPWWPLRPESYIAINLYVGALFIHLFLELFDDIIIENHFIFFVVFHVKIFHKIPIVVGGLMLEYVLFVSYCWNIGLEGLSAFDIHICERIDCWVWEYRNRNRPNSLSVALIEMHVRTDLLMAGCHFSRTERPKLKINFIFFVRMKNILLLVHYFSV